jgi:EAL domain-containing protein (putative c-di-GMP-specific phosphodiesterase class I)/PAS domain-containing protein
MLGSERSLKDQALLRLESEQQRGTMTIANQIEGTLSQYFSDFLIIYNSNESSEYVATPNEETLNELAALFDRFRFQKPYMQAIRFFDHTGTKLIDVHDGDASLIHSDEQNRQETALFWSVYSDERRTFYLETSMADDDDKLRLTLALPLYRRNQVIGILAIDYDGCSLFSYLVNQQHSSVYPLEYQMLSPEGLMVTIAEPDCNQMIVSDENLFEVYPSLAQAVRANKIGTIHLEGKTFTWQTLYAYPDGWLGLGESGSLPWSVFSSFDHQALIQMSEHLHLRFPWIKSVLALFIGLLVGAISLLSRLRFVDRHQVQVSSLVAEYADNGILVCDAEGRIQLANKAFVRDCGYPLETLVGQQAKFCRTTTAQADGVQAPCWLTHADGNHSLYTHSIIRVQAQRGTKEQQVEIYSQSKWSTFAAFDGPLVTPLLDLLQLKKVVEESGEVSAVVVRLHNSVEIGMSLSPTERRAFALRFAASLRSLLRTKVGVVAFDFDSYLVILPNVGMNEGLAKRIREVIGVLQSPADERSKGMNLRVVCGISNVPSTSIDGPSLLNDAFLACDMAMVEKGRGYRFFTEEVRHYIQRKEKIAHSLTALFSTDQLFLALQPIVSVSTGEIVGAEALVRWNHPSLGLLFPGEFLPAITEAGYSERLGRFVIAQALRFIVEHRIALQKLAPQFTLALNLSAEEFNTPTLIDYLGSMLREHRIADNQITIELTEHTAIGNFQSANTIIKKLRAQGLMIAIDDFGTGFSSLSYLLELAVDKIKIDRSFIARYRDDESVTIYKTVLLLAKQIKAQVVAEGVESEEQLAFIKEIGCDEYQGFYFSRAIEEQQFLNLLQKTNKKGAP